MRRRFLFASIFCFAMAAILAVVGILESRPRWRPYSAYQGAGPVLHLPFYKYGAEQSKIWDISGNNNHGTITGAVPATYPMLSGTELVTNGTFTGAATGWTLGAAWAYNANNVIKNADGITTLSQTVPVTAGKRYRLNFWVSDWTVGTVTPSCGGFTGTARGADRYYEEIFIATSTADLVFTPTDTSRFTLDTISIQEVTGYEGLGWGFDGVDDRVVHSSLNLGTAHALHYWIGNRWADNTGVVHGGAVNYHGLRITETQVGYNVGTTEVLVNHNGLVSTQGKTLFSISRSGTSVSFYQNGVQIGATQTLLANNALTVTDLGRYSTPGSYWKGAISEAINFNVLHSAQEIRNYCELTRGRYGR